MLPELPKKIKRKEADFGIEFRKWVKKHPFFTSSLEMKQTDGKSYLNFSEVKDAQINYGRLIKSNKGTLIRTKGIKGLPDYVYLRATPAFIVIKYPKFFAIIDVDDFQEEKENSKRKSLESEDAKRIAKVIINL